MHLATVLAATQPALEFVDGRLEGAIEAVRAALTAHHRSVSVGGDLDVLAVLALAAVLLMLKFDVESADRVVDPFGANELLAHINAVVIRYLDVAAGHLDVGVRRGLNLLVVGRELK
jgi:hypothetical protein